MAVVPTSGALPGMGDLGFSLKKALRTVATSAIPIVGPSMAIKKVAQDSKGLPQGLKKVLVTASTLAIPVAGSVMVTKQLVDSKGASLMASSPKALFVRQVKKGGQSTGSPAPGQGVAYLDINGAPITQAQYNAIIQAMTTGVAVPIGGLWATPAGYMTATNPTGSTVTPAPLTSDPGSSSGTSYTDIVTPTDPSAASSGGGGGGSDYSLAP